MASEPSEEVSVRLPAELESWLDDQARELGVDRETVLVQMLTTYRATAELDGDGEESVLDAVDARVEDRVEAAVTERLSEATEAVQRRVGGQVEELDREFQGKIEDVRERVIQVKQEADAKAPADHDHEEFERLATAENRLDTLEDEVEQLREGVQTAAESEDDLEELEEELATAQERLRTVAWAVRDLRDSVESDAGLEAVDRVKRAAAKADVDRAVCENCGEGVEIALLTDPNCPHCEATVTDVQEASGFFSKPKLLVASQLESGDEE
jgi:DNA repair exonuclease SbcCD ATPase subunit